MAEGGEGAHEERERYAVAAMAFCLKHSPSYRADFRQFLVLKLGFGPSPDEVEFEVEPRHEADLVVRSTSGKKFYAVVEFKIGAHLKSHQDPRSRKKFAKGYGRQLSRKKKEGWANVGYIVIWQESLEQHQCDFEGSISTAICHWDELRRNSSTSDSLQKDLFQCLGQLGVNCMKDMKTTVLSEANSACQVHDYFIGILNDDQLCRRVRANGVDAKTGEDNWHYGLNFSLKPGGLKGWLGYESKGKPCPSVWFYCENEKQRKLVAKALQTYTESGSKEDGWLWYQYPPDGRKSEREWFVDVLSKITANQRTA